MSAAFHALELSVHITSAVSEWKVPTDVTVASTTSSPSAGAENVNGA